jgi:HD superfamily phosphohydrolase
MRATISAPGSPIRWRLGQIARALARALGLDDDLAEALALAHDLGHTPFDHTGELKYHVNRWNRLMIGQTSTTGGPPSIESIKKGLKTARIR